MTNLLHSNCPLNSPTATVTIFATVIYKPLSPTVRRKKCRNTRIEKVEPKPMNVYLPRLFQYCTEQWTSTVDHDWHWPGLLSTGSSAHPHWPQLQYCPETSLQEITWFGLFSYKLLQFVIITPTKITIQITVQNKNFKSYKSPIIESYSMRFFTLVRFTQRSCDDYQ